LSAVPWPAGEVCSDSELGREIGMIAIGDPAPDFTLRSHVGEAVSLAGFRGEKWVVLHTFPLAFTGG